MQPSDDYAFPEAAAVDSSAEMVGRRVLCPRDMFRWRCSEAMADLAAFVERINAVARRGGPMASTAAEAATAGAATAGADAVDRVLRRVARWAAEIERDAGDGPCFGRFHCRLRTDGLQLLARAFGTPGDHRIVELAAHFERSFGDPDAASYGPQHELSFCMFLVALFKLHRLTCADEPHIVPVLYDRYLDLVDFLVSRYRLEPCVEYGNSALNDFRYVGFLWGSAQLAAADRYGSPDHQCPAAVIAGQSTGGGGIFAKCVDVAHRRAASRARTLGQPRPQPVWRHSYQLWKLTAWPHWSQVNECLMASFRPQVLDRFCVVQHLVFGELLGIVRNPRPPGVSFYDCIPAAATLPMTDGGMAAEDDDGGRKEDDEFVMAGRAMESLRLHDESLEEEELFE